MAMCHGVETMAAIRTRGRGVGGRASCIVMVVGLEIMCQFNVNES